MKVQIGVMGSAGGTITVDQLELARRVGHRIAERGAVIVTGACPGLPHAAVLGAHDAGGTSLGVSPAHSREEHVNVYSSPLQPYSTMVFTGSGLMGRETHNIHSSDFVIFVGGRSGTLGEFCIAYDEGKLIGVLTNSGGISNEFERIAGLVQKATGSTIITDDVPEKLVDRCFEYYQRGFTSSSVVFNRTAEYSLRKPVVTQETRG
ncbi:MAG TPA: hypothetical protein VNF68_00395 [Candidatus Baltobacteraceae bacterium]|nr:hypothetical protein [Candidatus Baltobacteraceae bacterium]